MSKLKDERVIMAMSGGIDSSVSAALLKEKGYSVIGVFMKFWKDKGKTCSNMCCSPESEKRARIVAQKLNIPFYVFNFEEQFKEKVVDYFLKEYKAGLTPNPCVVCNKEIKFGLLVKKLLSLKADYIALGHYAKNNGRLFKGKDKDKDQSYFLWQLDKKILKKTLFPLENLTKPEVRKLAKKFDLPVVNIPESQEVCFITQTTNQFLEKHLKTRPGEIIDTNNQVVGKHNGLWFYTIGQRRGLEVQQGPYYVLDKDIKKNVLIVTKNEKDLYQKELLAQKANWISEPKMPSKIMTKIRYGHKPSSATISKKGNRIKVEFIKPQKAITSGQSVVFYKGQELLGGAIII